MNVKPRPPAFPPDAEDAVLARLFPRLGPMPPDVVIPPGDDCAALRAGRGRLLLLTVDQVIGGRHYFATGRKAAPPELVGRKLMARNLSDIAAMGGLPLYALVTLALGPKCDRPWLERFFTGLLDLAREWETSVIGGDLARALHDTVASLTLTGQATLRHVCRRVGARPGDFLYATGRFGDSLPTEHHLRFTPRLREGHWLATQHFPRAMIDVSDGLMLDAFRLCRASNLALRLDTAAVPRRTSRTTLRNALTDGEDYELLLAVQQKDAGRLEHEWPFANTELTRIGEFRVGSPAVLDKRGRPLGLGLGGFDHFAFPAVER